MADETKSFDGEVLVLGSTGTIGQATVKFLSGKVRSIKAGTRNPDSDKAKALAELDGVTAVKAGDAASIEAAAKGADVVFIVTPGVEECAALATAYAKAAIAAGVTKIVAISVPCAASDSHLFARQFRAVEAELREVSADTVFLRLPFFTDNQWSNADTIKTLGKVFCPIKPDVAFATVAARDVGPAFLKVASNFETHKGRGYTLVSDVQTYGAIVKSFSDVLGKTVTYQQVPNEAAKKAMMEAGYPEWAVDGVNELHDLINAFDPILTSPTDDLETLIGRKGTSTAAWIAAAKAGFQ